VSTSGALQRIERPIRNHIRFIRLKKFSDRLSGFILSTAPVGNTFNYKPFLIARLVRIYPMLMVCLIIAADIPPTNLISVLTTLLPVNVSGGVGNTLAAMFWAVAVEFQCYLFFLF
jgi:peptidoglycan/LPS O-acetylase OafA/YrhL